MNALGYLSLMREKGVSFRVVQHGLKFSNLSSARGWEPLLEHYSEISSADINESMKELYLSQLFLAKGQYILVRSLKMSIVTFLSTLLMYVV